ncbi:MAG: hypothetical protein JNL28_12150 [Planctomycetes bacterium]|nr:hypothetical protein [Planctomycetota bacterium]
MRAFFETSDNHSQQHLRPLRVAMRVDAVWEEAKSQVADLPGWSITSADDKQFVLVCKRTKRFLSGDATITIRCEGPTDIPSATVHVRSESAGGIIARDKANIIEFLVPFERRVC